MSAGHVVVVAVVATAMTFVAALAASPAHAGDGWYLMRPGHVKAAKKPLKTWDKYAAFDTARECRTALATRQGIAEEAIAVAHAPLHARALLGERVGHDEEIFKAWELALERYAPTLMARCIAVNDPELSR